MRILIGLVMFVPALQGLLEMILFVTHLIAVPIRATLGERVQIIIGWEAHVTITLIMMRLSMKGMESLVLLRAELALPFLSRLFFRQGQRYFSHLMEEPNLASPPSS